MSDPGASGKIRIWWAIAVLLVLGMRPAGAQPADTMASTNRAVIDRIDLEPSVLTGQRMRVYLSAVSLQGSLLDLDFKSTKVLANGSELKAPFALGAYSGMTTETVIVVVVQAT